MNSIESIEREAFRSFWNDGLLDVMLGLAVLLIGISWWQNIAVLGAVFPAVCVSIWFPLRKRLIEPRMGYVEFSGPREVMARSFKFGLGGFFAGTMMLGVMIYVLLNNDILPPAAEWIAGFPLLLIAIPAVLFALFTQCKRFAVYALVLFISGVEMVIQGWEPHVGLIASGVFILVVGMFILLRFLGNHPGGNHPGQPSD